MNRIKPKITSKGFSPGKRGAAAQVLGELQTAVMEILWRESPLSVTDVEQKLQKKRHEVVSNLVNYSPQRSICPR